MKHPMLCDNAVRPLPFYLAMEEWVAEELPAADYFFAWRVQPTVICGRNQVTTFCSTVLRVSAKQLWQGLLPTKWA